MSEKYIDISSLPVGLIPPEIEKAFKDYLKVEGRIKFPLKPTSTSAVSTSSEEPGGEYANTEKDIDDLIDSVAELEGLIEQLEDMADQLTKDMSIPPANAGIAKAVARLGGDQNITQAVFNNALSIIDYAPIITLRHDPVTAALTGNGHIDGPWLSCSQVTAAAADLMNVAITANIELPESVIRQKSQEIAEDFEGNLLETILHILLMLWWNMIWPKFLVDLVIIDPLRLMIADPFDGLVGFFKKKTKFRKKSQAWIREYGKLNKALNRFRKYLLCKVPYKLWSRADEDYDPIVEITCNSDEQYTCPEDTTIYDNTKSATTTTFNPDGNAKEIGKAIDEQDGDGESDTGGPCGSPDEYGNNAPDDEPTTLGMSPECLAAAKKIVSEVESLSYTPRDPNAARRTIQTLGESINNNFIV